MNKEFNNKQYGKVNSVLCDLNEQNSGIPILGNTKIKWIKKTKSSKYYWLTNTIGFSEAYYLRDRSIAEVIVHELVHRDQAKKWKVLYPLIRVVPPLYKYFEQEALEIAEASVKLLKK